MLAAFTPGMLAALKAWADYNKGLRAILLQFSRARPGKGGVEDVEDSWALLVKAARWREAHAIPGVFRRGYAPAAKLEVKRRFLNAFFFGHAAAAGDGGGGEPIYYNCMANKADLDHADLVPGRFEINE